MTNREKEILRWIEENPFLSQAELALKANITRSSVAAHISNLIKKGKIIGKGYILQKNSYIAIVGGANIDISASSHSDLKDFDSNPGEIITSFGGVGRNIADNLSRLSQNVEFITVLGDDVNAKEIKKNCKELGVSISNSLTLTNSTTSTYISILDNNRDMRIAISAMDIYKFLSPTYIQTKKELIENSMLCVIDTNIPKETIKYMVNNFDTVFFLDCVSTSKAMKIIDFIGKFHTIKANKLEAEALSNIKIVDNSSLEKCAMFFIEKGVKQIFISLGENGVFFSNGTEFFHQPPLKTSIVSTTGAGDAFMAGIVYGFLEGMDILESCQTGIAAATITVASQNTVSENMNLENINKIKEEIL